MGKCCQKMKELFLLDTSIIYLNHGSFGACPIPVFENYQAWQRRLEKQPVLFLGRELAALDRETRQVLGTYLQTDAENLVFVTNATQGVNIIARSLAFEAADEILTTDHEYGACDYTWEFVCKKSGAIYKRQPISLPVSSPEEIIEQFWQGVTSRTKIICISHITSPTALHMPVEAICHRARDVGILTLVDGAHAPGQIELNLDKLGADWYIGNLHKWALCPKGAAFLYARPEFQSLVEPLIVSWGYHASPETTRGSQFQDYLGWTGTRDPAASLAVPAALQFMKEHRWDQVRQDCHDLLRPAIKRICDLVQSEPLYSLDSDFYHQMGIAPLLPGTDTDVLKRRLYDEYHVEVPLINWMGHDANNELRQFKFVRISVQGYNSADDLDTLYEGLQKLLPQVQT
jgi:isopenicillin-N epimerase